MSDVKSITPEHIESLIVKKEYSRHEGSTLTICILTLKNGFTTVGQSACVDPKMFRVRKGRTLAFEDARQKVWQLEGYLLQQQMYVDSLL